MDVIPPHWLMHYWLRNDKISLELLGIPEVRKLWRLSFWNGFLGGGLQRQVAASREEAINAIREYISRNQVT